MTQSILSINNSPAATSSAAVAGIKPGASTSFADTLNSAAQKSGRVDLDAIFQRASQTYNLPLNLLKAVAKAESNFNPTVVSRSGAQGIMQLMPGTARGLGVTDAFDPEQNIMGGAKYLRQMLDRFGGDTKLALAAYNAGPGNVIKYGGIPPFTETQNYVVKVMRYMGNDITAGSVPSAGTSGSATNLSALGTLSSLTGLSTASSGLKGLAGLVGPTGLAEGDLSAMAMQLAITLISEGVSESTLFGLLQLQLASLQKQTEETKSELSVSV